MKSLFFLKPEKARGCLGQFTKIILVQFVLMIY